MIMKPNFIKEGETRVKPYHTLSPNGEWGTAQWKGRAINIYTNKEFIEETIAEPIMRRERGWDNFGEGFIFADFGGADGTVADIVARALERQTAERAVQTHRRLSLTGLGDCSSKKPVCAFSVDISPEQTAYALQRRERGEISRDIAPIQADFDSLPTVLENDLEINTDELLNAAIMRFSLQYSKSPITLKRIVGRLHLEHPLVIQHCNAFEKNEGQQYGTLFSKINKVIRPTANLIYHSLSEIGESLTRQGYRVPECRDLPVEMWLNAESWASRFDITDNQVDTIDQILIKESKRKSSMAFSTQDSRTSVLCPISQMVVHA
jgi:hypothetical protein